MARRNPRPLGNRCCRVRLVGSGSSSGPAGIPGPRTQPVHFPLARVLFQFWFGLCCFGLCWCGCVRCLGRGRRVRCLSSRGLRRATGKQKRCSREPGDDHLHAGTVRHFRSNHRSTTSLPSRMARRSKWVTGRQSGRSITPPVQRPSSSKTSWIACAYCAQSVAMCQ